MGLFSSSPSNRRRRSKKKADRSWIDESTSSKPKSRAARKAKASPHAEAHQLHAQIGAIENFINKHHQAEVQRLKMKQENILPPPDRSKHRQARKKITMAARRRQNAERNRTSFKFLLMFCTACVLGWWLIFAGV